jgi:hypothetical protein
MASPWQVLRQQEADLINEGRAALATARTEGRLLTAEEITQDNERQERLATIRANLAVEERYREEQRQEQAVPDASLPGSGSAPTPFRSLGEQLLAVRSAALNPHRPDERLLTIQAATGASEGVASDGGFARAADFSSELLTNVHQASTSGAGPAASRRSANSNGLKHQRHRRNLARHRLSLGRRAGVLDGRGRHADRQQAEVPPDHDRAEEAHRRSTTPPTSCSGRRALGSGRTARRSPKSSPSRSTTRHPRHRRRHARGHHRPRRHGQHHQGNQPAGRDGAQGKHRQDVRPSHAARASTPSGTSTRTLARALRSLSAVGVGGVPVFVPPGGCLGAYGLLLGRPINPIEQCDTLGTVGDITSPTSAAVPDHRQGRHQPLEHPRGLPHGRDGLPLDPAHGRPADPQLR